MNTDVDILFISYNRPHYTRLAISRLLETCDETMRVWIWHNGSHQETLEVVKSFRNHPRVHNFHHSEKNLKLTAPTNWLWANAKGAYFSKVDDDSLVPNGWANKIKDLHQTHNKLGAIGCWRFLPEDYKPELAARKIRNFCHHQIMQHPWMEGSGYLIKRECIDDGGLLEEGESFPKYCTKLAWLGWIHGWYFPFLYSEHMDDPRAPNTLLKSDEDIKAHMPLTATKNNVETLKGWTDVIKDTAEYVQRTPKNPGRLYLPRKYLHLAKAKFKTLTKQRTYNVEK